MSHAPWYHPILFTNERPVMNAAPAHGARAVANWLLFCAGMVFVMAIIGAITRLTERRPVHHRMEADHRGPAAAERGAMAGRVREIQTNP